MIATRPSSGDTVSYSTPRPTCWIEALIVGLGLPATIWVASRIITVSVPAATNGSPGQRFLLWITGPSIAEWLFVLGLAYVLSRRRLAFRDLGVWRMGNWAAWLIALLFAALSIGSNLRFLPRMHIPLSYAFFPHGFHLAAAFIHAHSGRGGARGSQRRPHKSRGVEKNRRAAAENRTQAATLGQSLTLQYLCAARRASRQSRGLV